MKRRPHYEDAWDLVVQNFIKARQPFAGYWETSERNALRIAHRELVAKCDRHRMLDLGCGTGRMLSSWCASFKNVVGIEPDLNRYKQAEQTRKGKGLMNVKLLPTFFEDYEVEPPGFDVIFCGHVIQHLDTESVSAIMEKVDHSLNKGGVLILLTSCSNLRTDTYSTWENGLDGHVGERTISEEEFTALLLDKQNSSVLPMRKLGSASFAKLQPDMVLKKVFYFHAMSSQKWFEPLIFRDRWINWPWLRGHFGIDVLLAWEKLGA